MFNENHFLEIISSTFLCIKNHFAFALACCTLSVSSLPLVSIGNTIQAIAANKAAVEYTEIATVIEDFIKTCKKLL